jgi:hypothetical protein
MPDEFNTITPSESPFTFFLDKKSNKKIKASEK